jgi:hypothetical protein
VIAFSDQYRASIKTKLRQVRFCAVVPLLISDEHRRPAILQCILQLLRLQTNTRDDSDFTGRFIKSNTLHQQTRTCPVHQPFKGTITAAIDVAATYAITSSGRLRMATATLFVRQKHDEHTHLSIFLGQHRHLSPRFTPKRVIKQPASRSTASNACANVISSPLYTMNVDERIPGLLREMLNTSARVCGAGGKKLCQQSAHHPQYRGSSVTQSPH